MKAEIKDKNQHILSSLRAVGYNFNQQDVELILNIIDLIKESNNEVTIADILEMKYIVKSLFEN